MASKQKWLAERLIIPAGILPPAVNYSDLALNESSRIKVGIAGFEYVFMMDQDTEKINSSAIGKKVFAVHAPWPFFAHPSMGTNRQLIELMTNLVYGKNRIPAIFDIVAQKTFSFAKEVGAKIVVFHPYNFDQQNVKENLATLAQLEEKFDVTPVIEHEGSYIDGWLKSLRFDWSVKPDDLVKALDELYPRKKFNICIDTSSLYSYKLPLLETVRKVYARIGHLHLAGSLPGMDLAGEIDQPEIIKLVKFFFDKDYKGLINVEVSGTVGKAEGLIAQIYGGSSILHFPILKKQAVANAQRHIENSCKFLLDNI